MLVDKDLRIVLTAEEVAVDERAVDGRVELHDALGAVADDALQHLNVVAGIGYQPDGSAAIEVAIIDVDVRAVLAVDDATGTLTVVGVAHRQVLQSDVDTFIQMQHVGIAGLHDDGAALRATDDEVADVDQFQLAAVVDVAADNELALDHLTLGVEIVAPHAAVILDEGAVLQRIREVDLRARCQCHHAVAAQCG